MRLRRRLNPRHRLSLGGSRREREAATLAMLEQLADPGKAQRERRERLAAVFMEAAARAADHARLDAMLGQTGNPIVTFGLALGLTLFRRVVGYTTLGRLFPLKPKRRRRRRRHRRA